MNYQILRELHSFATKIRIMAVKRRRPQSNAARQTAIVKAKEKHDNPGPNGDAITAATATRLNAIHGTYVAAMTLIDQRTSEQGTSVSAKNAGLQTLRLLVKSFIGVFNYGVERGKYPSSHRHYYGIDANNSNLPDLSTET